MVVDVGGVVDSVMLSLRRIFLSTEGLRKIRNVQILTRLPTSETAEVLLRLIRALKYRISVREFVGKVGRMKTLSKFSKTSVD